VVEAVAEAAGVDVADVEAVAVAQRPERLRARSLRALPAALELQAKRGANCRPNSVLPVPVAAAVVGEAVVVAAAVSVAQDAVPWWSRASTW